MEFILKTMQYTDKDKAFLKALKDKGVSKEEAFQRLDAVKKRASQTPSQSTSQVVPAKEVKSILASGQMPQNDIRSQTIGVSRMPNERDREEAGKSIVSNIAAIPGAIYNSTVKPIGDLTNTVAGTALAGGQGILGGLSALNPTDFKPQEFESRFKKGMTSPTAIGTNPYKADTSGNIDVGQSVRNLAGDTLKGGAGVFNLATLLSSGGLLSKFAPNAAAGAALSAGEDIKNNNNLTSTALNALISGGLQGGLAKAPGALTAGRKGLAKIAGLSDSSIDLLQNPQIGQKVLSELPGAEAALRDETLNNPLQRVGQEVFKPAVNQLYKQNKVIGKQIGDVLKNSSKKLNLGDVYKDFTAQLKKIGGKVSKETAEPSSTISPYSTFIDQVKLPTKTSKSSIKFGEFSPIDNASDLKDLNTVFGVLDKYKSKPIPISKAYDLVKKIDARINYSFKTANPISEPAETALKAARKSLSNLIKNKLPESKKLFQDFANNSDTLGFFNPKLGENASSASVLKSIFSPQRKDELLPMLQNLEKQTGQQIINPTKIAKATMEIAGDPRGDMLLEVAKNPNMMGALQAVARKIVSPKGAAKDLVRLGQGKGLTKILPQGLSPKGAAIPTALSNALIQLLGTREAR